MRINNLDTGKVKIARTGQILTSYLEVSLVVAVSKAPPTDPWLEHSLDTHTHTRSELVTRVQRTQWNQVNKRIVFWTQISNDRPTRHKIICTVNMLILQSLSIKSRACCRTRGSAESECPSSRRPLRRSSQRCCRFAARHVRPVHLVTSRS